MKHRFRLALALLVTAACSSPSSQAVAPVKGADPDPPESAIDIPIDPREPVLAKGIGQLLETEHLLGRTIDDAISKQAFTEYLDRLDPGKLFLLDKDVRALQKHSLTMDNELADGNLALAHEGAAALARRQAIVRKVVADLLAKPFDLTIQEEIETDPDKLSFATTESELADRWRKTLKQQVLERVDRMNETADALAKGKAPDGDAGPRRAIALADIPKTAEGREQKAREDLAKSFDARFSRLAEIEPLEPAETFINAVAAVFDPHTLYLPPVDKENFDIALSGSLEGIGALLSEEDHYILVRELVPGGASWRQKKLEPGDLILAVAQEGEDPVDVADMRINAVVQLIRGPKGTVVTLTVKKPDDRIETISITRDVIQIEASYARGAVIELDPKQPPLGYIYLPSFYGNTRTHRGSTPEREAAADVAALLAKLRGRNVGGVVLDLRANGGGLLDDARAITGLFIETGPVVQTRYSSGDGEVLRDRDAGVAFRGDVVVLVDQFSASASEIVAAALQDYRRAVIVGTSATHGKGTVQVLLDLNRLPSAGKEDLGVLKLTVQQFFGIDGDSTQWRGVVPDILLPDPNAYIESGERYLDNAIPWSEVEGLPFETWSAPLPDVAELAAKSKARQANVPAFARIAERVDFLTKRRKQTKMPLEQTAWKRQREQDKAALDAADPKLDEGPSRFTVTPIEYGSAKSTEATKAQTEQWKKDLEHDPWVEESLRILTDMAAARP